jgi:hypothetical protein
MAGHGSIDHHFDDEEDRENVSPNVRDDNKPRFVAPKTFKKLLSEESSLPVNASSYLQKVRSSLEHGLIFITVRRKQIIIST